MSRADRVVYEDGRWNGRTLREWLPDVVDDIVRACHPVKVILFGSVARGEEGPESDLDLLVVLDEIDPDEKPELMGQLRRAIAAPVPVNVFLTDAEEIERRRDVVGSLQYWPLREGEVVYQRSTERL